MCIREKPSSRMREEKAETIRPPSISVAVGRYGAASALSPTSLVPFSVFVMESLYGFLVLCALSMISLVVELTMNVETGHYQIFCFFTIWTNILTWIYFLLKLIHILSQKRKRTVISGVLGEKTSYLDSATSRSTYESFLTILGFVATVSMTLVGVVFWALLSWEMVRYCDFDYV